MIPGPYSFIIEVLHCHMIPFFSLGGLPWSIQWDLHRHIVLNQISCIPSKCLVFLWSYQYEENTKYSKEMFKFICCDLKNNYKTLLCV